MEIQTILDTLFAQYASQPAFLLGPHRITYGVLRRRVCSVSRSLLALGCGPGSRVVYLRAADNFYVEFFLACVQIGAAFCPLSPKMPRDQLLAAVAAAKGTFFAADRDMLDFLSDQGGYPLSRQNAITFSSSRKYLSYVNLTKKQLALPVQSVPPQSPALCFYNETAGSVYSISLQSLAQYLKHCIQDLRHPSGAAFLCIPFTCLPYIQELLLALASGDAMLPFGSFEPKDFIKIVSAYPVDSVFLTPSLINSISMDAKSLVGDFSRLRRVRLGRAYLNQSTAQNLESLLPPHCLVEKYIGFPRILLHLSLTAAQLCPHPWTAAVPVNSLGRPDWGCSVFPGSAGPCTSRQPGTLYVSCPEWEQPRPMGRGWVDCIGHIYPSWEPAQHMLPAGTSFSRLYTQSPTRTEAAGSRPHTFQLEDYLTLFDSFAKLSPYLPTEEFRVCCCQSVLDHLPVAGAALALPKVSPQATTTRVRIIQEIYHTAQAIPFPQHFLLRDSTAANGFPYRSAEPSSESFPPGLELTCYPIYALNFHLLGELYLATEPGFQKPEWFPAWLRLILRHLSVLISSHQSHADSLIRLSLYQHAMELASDGIGISGMEAKPSLLFTNFKSAQLINLGKTDPEFGRQLERTQIENFQALHQNQVQSSSRSFFYDDPVRGNVWVNYRTERVYVNGDPYAITYCNMQENSHTNTISHFHDLLSARELEVVNLISKGMTNKEISAQLDMSINTVKFHVARIYRKLHVGNRSELLSSIILHHG